MQNRISHDPDEINLLEYIYVLVKNFETACYPGISRKATRAGEGIIMNLDAKAFPINKKRHVIAKMGLRNSKEALLFDRKFWSDAGSQARFSAAWEMIREASLFKGEKDVGQSRLQRSVCVLQRRKR